MKEKARYAKNLRLFSRDNPKEAFHLDPVECSLMRFCHTDEKELNLVDESQKQKVYLHPQSGALCEANYWAKKLPFENTDVIFIYGLGLGYYYIPLKKWLEEDPGHYLVFLEDNSYVVHFFLRTGLATEILENPQVMVKELPKFEPNEKGWAELRKYADPIFLAFAFFKPRIFALNAYFASRFDFYHAFSLQWLNGLSRVTQTMREYYPNESLGFQNFYTNIHYLPEAIPGYKLANAMQSVPAVLCGAGPSLSKQLPFLETLSERVFLIASGSAMNVVTQASMMPHAGGAIDPTPAQASRQLTSFGYEVPGFYQNFFYSHALAQWHGPLLYITGSGNYRVSEWFERELGMEDAVQIIMGVSTSNFLLEIVNFLGCNPIVLVGMDLAYIEGSHYAQGVFVHPTEGPERSQELDRKPEVLMAMPGFDEKDVFTTNQWFFEAVCIGAFKERNPKVICLNATEGGMIIPSVPNEPLSDAAAEYFTESWDIEGWFHGEIQNASRYRIPASKVAKAVRKWKTSLEACLHSLELLVRNFEEKLSSSQRGKSYQNEKMALWQQELYKEPAYEFLLDTLNSVFDKLNSLRFRKLKWCSSKKERKIAEFSLEFDRYVFLKSYNETHLKSIDEGIKAFEDRQTALLNGPERQQRLNPERAVYDDKMHQNSEGEGQILNFYTDGTIKVEAFYQRGKLHGPWSFYSPEGRLLFRRRYFEGKKEGKAYAYYLNGALYSIKGYSGGVAEGEHLYYYPDGTLKTEEHYEKGLLQGVVRLYYSNGRLKKEQHFIKGLLDRQERLWNERGTLIMEAFYDHGKIVGESKKWDPDGKLMMRNGNYESRQG